MRAEALRIIRDKGPISTTLVARELDVDVNRLSYHVRKLKEFNCIEEVDTRRVGGSIETFYRATEQHVIDTVEWGELAEDDPGMAEFSVDEYMQSIVDDYSSSRKAGLVGLDEEFWVVRHLLGLDPEGFAEAEKAAESFESTLLEIKSRSAERAAKHGTTVLPVSASIVYFKLPKG